MSDAKFTPGPWGAFSDESGKGHTNIVSFFPRTEVVFSLPGRHKSEPDVRLASAAPDLLEALIEGRRAIGEHSAPGDCYATGPMTGDESRDLVQCPACTFIGLFDAAIKKATGAQS